MMLFLNRVIHCLLMLMLWTAGMTQMPARGDLRLLILSDFNGAYGSLDYAASVDGVIALAQQWHVDGFVSAGDVIAGQSRDLSHERFAQMWQVFDNRVYQPLARAGIPIIVAMGNHDGSSQRNAQGYVFARERDAARNYWQQRMWQQRMNALSLNYLDARDVPFQFSLLLDEVFIAVWDASSATMTTGQLEWLAAELARSEVANARARILVGHLPLFGVSASRNRPGEVLTNGAELATWLSSQGIDLYISGHHAAYYPAHYGNLLLLHTGGVGGRQLIGSDQPARSTVTLLDIDFQDTSDREKGGKRATIRETTFDLATLTPTSITAIDPRTLPASITNINGAIQRWAD